MRYLISGGRTWPHQHEVENRVLDMDCVFDVLIHGACPVGADKHADDTAKETGIQVIRFPAKWKWFGKSAGNIRNEQMIVEGKPDYAYCFWDGKSPGTRNMIKLLVQHKIAHEVIPATGAEDAVMLGYDLILGGHPRQGSLY